MVVAINFKLKNFLRVLMPFGLTQALGIYAARKFLPDFLTIKPADFGGFSFLDIAILAIFAAMFIFIAAKFSIAASVIFKIILTFLIFSGSQAMFGIWFGQILSSVLAVVLVILFWFMRDILIQNIAMAFTISGIGAVVGLSLQPLSVVYVLVAFSFYDIISVYKTGHMIKLAQAMIKSRAIFGFVIPEPGRTVRHKISGVAPGEGFMILGSGDVIFPLLLSASLIRVSLQYATVVALFSISGLLLMHLIFSNQKIRQPMAALPPIALMSIIGYLVVNLI